jgi:hypothetical protein
MTSDAVFFIVIALLVGPEPPSLQPAITYR